MRALSVVALAFVSASALAQYDIAVTKVEVLNHQLLPITPTLGDPGYGVGGTYTVTGDAYNLPVTLVFTCGARSEKVPVVIPKPGTYNHNYPSFNSSLYGIIPIGFSVESMKGDKVVRNRLRSSFKPVYPIEAIDRYAANPIYVSQTGEINIIKNVDQVDLLRAYMHMPPTTDWQGPITNYTSSEGAAIVKTKPSGIPVLMSEWRNFKATSNFKPFIDQTFNTTVRNTRINPDLMATIPWAAIDAPLPPDVAPWTQSEDRVPTNAPQITELVNRTLPKDYRNSMTPWEAVQMLFLAPVKRMRYYDNKSVNPLNAWDVRRGQCGDYAYLFVVAMRRIGFAARVNVGWRRKPEHR